MLLKSTKTDACAVLYTKSYRNELHRHILYTTGNTRIEHRLIIYMYYIPNIIMYSNYKRSKNNLSSGIALHASITRLAALIIIL